MAIHPDYWPRLHRPEPRLFAAIGCQGLAINHSVEVVLTVLFTGEGTTAPLARDHYVK